MKLTTLSVCALILTGCGVLPGQLPEERPPLADLEEPRDLFAEPDDEADRRALPLGSFTGAYVEDARDSLDALLGEPRGVVIERIVENSPAEVAGLASGDWILEAGCAGQTPQPIGRPSEWRALELACEPGSTLTVVADRAGVPFRAEIATLARVRPTARQGVQRLREEERVGVVVRTATEVEARAAGLGPGGGAVVVGLSVASPWRDAGLRFGDLIRSIDDVPITGPEVVLDQIRSGAEEVELEFVRDGRTHRHVARLSERDSELREIYVPLLFHYERNRDESSTSILFGLFQYESTPAASRTRLLWLIRFGTGDADRLEEVDE